VTARRTARPLARPRATTRFDSLRRDFIRRPLFSGRRRRSCEYRHRIPFYLL